MRRRRGGEGLANLTRSAAEARGEVRPPANQALSARGGPARATQAVPAIAARRLKGAQNRVAAISQDIAARAGKRDYGVAPERDSITFVFGAAMQVDHS